MTEWTESFEGVMCVVETSNNRTFRVTQNYRGVFLEVCPTRSPSHVVSSKFKIHELGELIVALVEARLKAEGVNE